MVRAGGILKIQKSMPLSLDLTAKPRLKSTAVCIACCFVAVTVSLYSGVVFSVS